jgi:hypothetical protein
MLRVQLAAHMNANGITPPRYTPVVVFADIGLAQPMSENFPAEWLMYELFRAHVTDAVIAAVFVHKQQVEAALNLALAQEYLRLPGVMRVLTTWMFDGAPSDCNATQALASVVQPHLVVATADEFATGTCAVKNVMRSSAPSGSRSVCRFSQTPTVCFLAARNVSFGQKRLYVNENLRPLQCNATRDPNRVECKLAPASVHASPCPGPPWTYGGADGPAPVSLGIAPTPPDYWEFPPRHTFPFRAPPVERPRRLAWSFLGLMGWWPGEGTRSVHHGLRRTAGVLGTAWVGTRGRLPSCFVR